MSDFDDFWNGNDTFKRYPRRAKKEETEREYWRARKDYTHTEIMNAVQMARKHEYDDLLFQKKQQYIPLSVNWFRDHRYVDWIDFEEPGRLSESQKKWWQERMNKGLPVPDDIRKVVS